jgi:hypothetical protein
VVLAVLLHRRVAEVHAAPRRELSRAALTDSMGLVGTTRDLGGISPSRIRASHKSHASLSHYTHRPISGRRLRAIK